MPSRAGQSAELAARPQRGTKRKIDTDQELKGLSVIRVRELAVDGTRIVEIRRYGRTRCSDPGQDGQRFEKAVDISSDPRLRGTGQGDADNRIKTGFVMRCFIHAFNITTKFESRMKMAIPKGSCYSQSLSG